MRVNCQETLHCDADLPKEIRILKRLENFMVPRSLRIDVYKIKTVIAKPKTVRGKWWRREEAEHVGV